MRLGVDFFFFFLAAVAAAATFAFALALARLFLVLVPLVASGSSSLDASLSLPPSCCPPRWTSGIWCRRRSSLPRGGDGAGAESSAGAGAEGWWIVGAGLPRAGAGGVSRVSCDTCCTISTDRDSYERGPRLTASEKTNLRTWAKSGLYSLGLATIAVRNSKDTHPHQQPSKQDKLRYKIGA